MFDEDLTILVGRNESGKSAILEALNHLNRDSEISNVDICEFGDIRAPEGPSSSKSDFPIVTVWLTFNSHELLELGLPAVLADNEICLSKGLHKNCRVEIDANLFHNEDRYQQLLHLIDQMAIELSSVYRGRVKAKQPYHQFVYLEQCEGEPASANLILFPEWAPLIWEQLKTGDWIQVTRIARDPLGRNSRALNAGMEVELETLKAMIAKLKDAVSLHSPITEVLEEIRQAIAEQIPDHHPISLILNQMVVTELQRLSEDAGISASQLEKIKESVLAAAPSFVYLPAIPVVNDSISVAKIQDSGPLLAALARMIGLSLGDLQDRDTYNRDKTLGVKSRILTQRLNEYWASEKFECDLSVDGKKLKVWVRSGGSGDPPSRRSLGLRWYISLWAILSDMARRERVVLLLDDPAAFLHPAAQEKLIEFFNAQPFQIIMATHLPSMIDPERIDRVRVVARQADLGTRVIEDWGEAKEALKPVWGALLGRYFGGRYLIVEGPTDKSALETLSRVCRDLDKGHLPADVQILTGGGAGSAQHIVEELQKHRRTTLVVLDGDDAGKRGKKSILKRRVCTTRDVWTLLDLLDIGRDELVTKDLFDNPREWELATGRQRASAKKEDFGAGTIDNFSRIFLCVTQRLGEIDGRA